MIINLVILLNMLRLAQCNEAQEARTLTDANTEFAWRVYKAVSAKTDNVIFSPYSISVALTMASTGANRETLTEMSNTLGYSSLKEYDVLAATRRSLRDLNADTKNFEMSMANKLYAEQAYTFKWSFIRLLRNTFGSSLEKLDFLNKPEVAREEINDWVQGKTNGRIKEILLQDLLPPDSITPLTRLYLVNGMQFSGKWMYRFKEEYNMVNQIFHVSKSETTQVTYVSRYGQKGNYPYAEIHELDAKLLEIPYSDSEISMYVLLPNSVEGLNKLEMNLSASVIKPSNEGNIFSRPQAEYNVDLRLPKFNMTQPIQLKEILMELGMIKAFTRAADFSRMSDRPISISDVVHKTFITVDEEGTDAAEASGVGVDAYSLWTSEPKKFHADHPFLYFIREKTTGSILFLGRYVAPPGEDGELPRVGEVEIDKSQVPSSSTAAPSIRRATATTVDTPYMQWWHHYHLFNQPQYQLPFYHWTG